QPDAICVVDVDGRAVESELPPSSELPLHLAVYRHGAASAIVHTHSPYATALSAVLDELPPVHYLLAELGGPVRVARYATFGTDELARNVVDALQGRQAALIESHGAITLGGSVARAYGRSVTLEWLAALYYRARLLG